MRTIKIVLVEDGMRKLFGSGILMALFLMIIPSIGVAQDPSEEGPVEKWKAKTTDKLETACRTELETYCLKVVPGNKRGLACIYAHSDKLSHPCEMALYEAAGELQNAMTNLEAFARSCNDDMKKLCSSVEPGKGRILACLGDHRQEVSERCNEFLDRAEGDLGETKDLDYQYHTASIN
jgi:hypothetical protein